MHCSGLNALPTLPNLPLSTTAGVQELVVEDRISVLENLCRRPVPDGCLGGEVEAEREAWRSPFCFQQVDTGQTLPVTTNIVRRKLFTSENNIYI